jgi:hypothetical protein
MIPIALGKKLFKDAKVRRRIFAQFFLPIEDTFTIHHSNISRI